MNNKQSKITDFYNNEKEYSFICQNCDTHEKFNEANDNEFNLCNCCYDHFSGEEEEEVIYIFENKI